MKRHYCIKYIFAAMVFICLIASINPSSAYASTRTDNITELVSQMERFENKMLSEIQQMDLNVGEIQKIKLNSRTKVEAAFYARSTKVIERFSLFDNDIEYTENVIKSAKSLKNRKKIFLGQRME